MEEEGERGDVTGNIGRAGLADTVTELWHLSVLQAMTWINAEPNRKEKYIDYMY